MGWFKRVGCYRDSLSERAREREWDCGEYRDFCIDNWKLSVTMGRCLVLFQLQSLSLPRLLFLLLLLCLFSWCFHVSSCFYCLFLLLLCFLHRSLLRVLLLIPLQSLLLSFFLIFSLRSLASFSSKFACSYIHISSSSYYRLCSSFSMSNILLPIFFLFSFLYLSFDVALIFILFYFIVI